VIPTNREDRNGALFQTRHLLVEEKRGSIILLVTIVEIAGDQDKVHLLLQGEIHQIDEGAASGAANGLNGSIVMSGQATQGAIQMEIGGMKESQHGRLEKVSHPGDLVERGMTQFDSKIDLPPKIK